MIWFIIGNDLWALGAKIDWTLYFKVAYLLWFVAGWKFISRKAGLGMTISAIVATEFEQGLMYKWNHNNFCDIGEIVLVTCLSVLAYLLADFIEDTK